MKKAAPTNKEFMEKYYNYAQTEKTVTNNVNDKKPTEEEIKKAYINYATQKCIKD